MEEPLNAVGVMIKEIRSLKEKVSSEEIHLREDLKKQATQVIVILFLSEILDLRQMKIQLRNSFQGLEILLELELRCMKMEKQKAFVMLILILLKLLKKPYLMQDKN